MSSRQGVSPLSAAVERVRVSHARYMGRNLVRLQRSSASVRMISARWEFHFAGQGGSMNRKEVVVLNLVVVLKRGDDAGPTQDVEAIRQAALDQLDQVGVEVHDAARSEPTSYSVTVASAQVASRSDGRRALEALGMTAES